MSEDMEKQIIVRPEQDSCYIYFTDYSCEQERVFGFLARAFAAFASKGYNVTAVYFNIDTLRYNVEQTPPIALSDSVSQASYDFNEGLAEWAFRKQMRVKELEVNHAQTIYSSVDVYCEKEVDLVAIFRDDYTSETCKIETGIKKLLKFKATFLPESIAKFHPESYSIPVEHSLVMLMDESVEESVEEESYTGKDIL